MLCAAASQEMASIGGASGLQRQQMKVGRRCQPPFEEVLLKPQRQKDVGMVVQDLLPHLSPCQEAASPAHPGAGALEHQRKLSSAHLPRKGNYRTGRS